MIVLGQRVKKVFLEEGGTAVPIGEGKALVFTDTFSRSKVHYDKNPAVVHEFYGG